MSNLLEELGAVLSAVESAIVELRAEHRPLVFADGKDPVGCTLCYPADGHWPCTAAQAADDLAAALAPAVSEEQVGDPAGCPVDAVAARDEVRIADLTIAELAEGLVSDVGELDLTVTPSRVTYRADEFRSSTPRAAASVTWLRALPDAVILDVARTPGADRLLYGPMHRILVAHVGEDTNPAWVVGRCCEIAYDRGLLNEVEFDFLTDRCS